MNSRRRPRAHPRRGNWQDGVEQLGLSLPKRGNRQDDADPDVEAPRADQGAVVLAAGKGLVLAVRAMLGDR
jgi:hypothetical protein